MTNEQILKKAIEKAVKNGFEITPMWATRRSIEQIIFSHDFAKAFWKSEKCRFGKECPIYPKKGCAEAPGWKRRLEEMVTEKEPLKYLKKFI